ncbi:MAG TPA: pitrilysin family protein [Longimicrobiales bacterium]|nr:pitrilysin family protein [Longimicrobiales bacterium]
MKHVKIPFQQTQLSNGLRVFVHEDPRTPVACVNLWYFVGSKDERAGRTGFAHLFEHLMFEGSGNVHKGQFDELLEAVGGGNNGSTSPDRTNYWETVPANALQLPLFLESDRMGWFLETITQEKLDGQRDVVKNERLQSYENRPYGLAYETTMKHLYPPSHPYHWPVIGWMADLDAATLADVRSFFATYYAPNNATLAVAGAIEANAVFELAEHYFGSIAPVPAPPRPVVPDATLAADVVLAMEDAVHLPRLYMSWHSPRIFAEGDAELDIAARVLASGKTARLYQRLVHDLEIAQDVEAEQESGLLTSTFSLSVTAREGISLARIHDEVQRVLSETMAQLNARELERARNHIETATLDAVQSVGGFGGKADRLNHYFFYAQDPGYLETDLQRYALLTPEHVRNWLGALTATSAVTLSVVPHGHMELAVRA